MADFACKNIPQTLIASILLVLVRNIEANRGKFSLVGLLCGPSLDQTSMASSSYSMLAVSWQAIENPLLGMPFQS